MEPQVNPDLLEQIFALVRQGRNFGLALFQPWRLYQIGILTGLFLFSHMAAKILVPRIDHILRDLEDWPKWRLRVAVLFKQRTRAILFVTLLWLLIWVMLEVTWPSRSYLLRLAAELATAWLVISIVTRLMRNQLFRRLLRWGAWIFVTLNIIGLSDEVSAMLDWIGIDLGPVHISLLKILQGAVVLILLFASARMLILLASRRLEAMEEVSPSMRVLSVKALQLLGYSLVLLIGLQAVGFDVASLTVLSGAIGLGLGFGLQKVVSNLVSGVILLLDKSIKPGDVISLEGTFGWISSLGARYVSVLTRNGTEYLIPNEDLITNRVVNWSHSSDLVRLDVNFGVSYDSDPHEIKKLAPEAAKSVKRVVAVPAPVCHIVGFGDSSVDFVLRFWIRDPTKGLTNVRGDVFLALWDALKESGVEIPFPRQDIRMLPEE